MKLQVCNINKTNNCLVSFTINLLTDKREVVVSVRCWYSRRDTGCNWFFHSGDSVYLNSIIRESAFNQLKRIGKV